MFEYTEDANWESVPGFHGYYYATWTAGANSQIVSLGWQNEGNATELYASQMFIYNNGANAYIQVVNTSPTDTNIKLTCVSAPISTSAGAEAIQGKIEASTVVGKAQAGSKNA